MGVTALVMAGGKATRMRMRIEKPLLKIGRRTMLEYVIDALQSAHYIDRIIVAVSPRTPKTARKAIRLGVDVMVTPGKGFVEDMQYAIKASKLREVLVVCSDLPFLKSSLVDSVVEEFRRNSKPSMAVVVTVETATKLGITPTYVIGEETKFIPVGLNMIDGKRVHEPELDELLFVVDSEALALNVNTPRELQLAREGVRLVSHEQNANSD